MSSSPMPNKHTLTRPGRALLEANHHHTVVANISPSEVMTGPAECGVICQCQVYLGRARSKICRGQAQLSKEPDELCEEMFSNVSLKNCFGEREHRGALQSVFILLLMGAIRTTDKNRMK